jgi:hypothetical protein
VRFRQLFLATRTKPQCAGKTGINVPPSVKKKSFETRAVVLVTEITAMRVEVAKVGALEARMARLKATSRATNR